MNLYNTPMLPGPFDDSATARQARMGLLQSDGSPEQDAVSVLARVYAGLLFDDLCETLPDMEQVYAICNRFEDLMAQGDARKTLLYIQCGQLKREVSKARLAVIAKFARGLLDGAGIMTPGDYLNPIAFLNCYGKNVFTSG